jgi:hypothetical protein
VIYAGYVRRTSREEFFSVRILCKVFYDKTDAACIVHFHQQVEAGVMKNQSVRWEETLRWCSCERNICLSLQRSEKMSEPLTVLRDHLEDLRRGDFYPRSYVRHRNLNSIVIPRTKNSRGFGLKEYHFIPRECVDLVHI